VGTKLQPRAKYINREIQQMSGTRILRPNIFAGSSLSIPGGGVAPSFWDTFTGDDFTGTNGDLPNETVWTVQDGAGSGNIVRIFNNALRSSLAGDLSTFTLTTSTFDLTGDFDIQIDWDVDTGPAVNNWGFSLRVEITDGPGVGYSCLLSRLYAAGQKIRYTRINPGTTVSDVGTVVTSGKFRFTRVAGAFQGFHDVGGGWVNSYPAAFFTDTNDLRVRFQSSNGELDPAAVFDYDNFLINSGTVVAPS
jgi:hypothetical protein